MSETNISTQQIQDLRNAFLEELESKGDTGLHSHDVNRVKTDDNWLKRFLLHQECDQKNALQMMWEVVEWRRDFKVNDINENTIRMDYMVEGAFFTRGRDKDGAAIFIFKCKKHTKGGKDMDEIKKCVVYWFERLERQEMGKPITLFFDMEGCGLGNMDMEFTKYLIGLFKQYYPYFLNLIIIYEMAWILNAAFKIIKSWLPEKAVQKIKMIKKSEITTWIPLDQALKCWGGEDEYVYSFVPEITEDTSNIQASSKKVHFADGSSMSEFTAVADKESDGGALSVTPSGVITFVKDGADLVSLVELQNTDPTSTISYKMKTTSPEKFRVRPSAGCLAPDSKAKITVTLLPGFHLGGLTRDKFLVMSIPVENINMSQQELTDLWKNTSGKNVSQHRLRCAQSGNENSRNGNIMGVTSNFSEIEQEHIQIAKLSNNVAKLQECQKSLHKAIKNTQILQYVTMILVIALGIVLYYIFKAEIGNYSSPSCYSNDINHLDNEL